MGAPFPLLATSSSMTLFETNHADQGRRPFHLGEPIQSLQSSAPEDVLPMALINSNAQDMKSTPLFPSSSPNTTQQAYWKKEKTALQGTQVEQAAVLLHGSHAVDCIDARDGTDNNRQMAPPSGNRSTRDPTRTPPTASSLNSDSITHIGLPPARLSTAYLEQRQYDAHNSKEQTALVWEHSASTKHSVTGQTSNGSGPQEKTPNTRNAGNVLPAHSSTGFQHPTSAVIDGTESCALSYAEQQDACSGYGTPALYSPLFSSPSSSSALSSVASSLGAPPSTFCSPLSMPNPPATTPGVPLLECSGSSCLERVASGSSLPLSSTEKLKATLPALPVCLWSTFPDVVAPQIDSGTLQPAITQDAINPTSTTTSSLGSVQTTASTSPELSSITSHSLNIPDAACPKSLRLHSSKNEKSSHPSHKDCATLTTNVSPTPPRSEEPGVGPVVLPRNTEEDAEGSTATKSKSFKTLFSSLLQDPHFSPVVKPRLPASDCAPGNPKHQQSQSDIMKTRDPEVTAGNLATWLSQTKRRRISESVTDCTSERTADSEVVLQSSSHVFSLSGAADSNDGWPTMPPAKKRRGSVIPTNGIQTPHGPQVCHPFYTEALPLPMTGSPEGYDVIRHTSLLNVHNGPYPRRGDTSISIISNTSHTQKSISPPEGEDSSYIPPDSREPHASSSSNPTIRRIRLSRPVGYAGMRLYSPSTVPLSNGVLQVHRQGSSMGTQKGVIQCPAQEHANHLVRNGEHRITSNRADAANGQNEILKRRTSGDIISIQTDPTKLCQASNSPLHSPSSRAENLQIASANILAKSAAPQTTPTETTVCVGNNPHSALVNGSDVSRSPESWPHSIHEETHPVSTMGRPPETISASEPRTAYFESPTCKFDRLKRELHVCWKENNQSKVQKFSCKKLGKETVFKKAQALMLRIACMALQWPVTNAHYARPGSVVEYQRQTPEAVAESQNERAVGLVRPSSRDSLLQDNQNTITLKGDAHINGFNDAEEYNRGNSNSSSSTYLTCFPVTSKPLEEIIYEYDGPYAPTLTYKKLSREWIVEWTVEGMHRIARWSCKKLGKYEAITRAERFVNLLALGVSDPQIRRSSKRPSAMGAKLFGSCSSCPTPFSHHYLKPHFSADQTAPDRKRLVMSPLNSSYAFTTLLGGVSDTTPPASTSLRSDRCL